MPDQLKGRVLVTGLLIMVTVAGIRAVGPGGDWARPAKDAVVVGLLLEVLIAAMYVALRWRRPAPPGLAGRLHKIVSAALVISFVGVLIGLILYEYRNTLGKPGHIGARVRVMPSISPHSVKFTKISPAHWPPLRDVLVAILIVVILAVLLTAWYRRRTTGPRLGGAPDLGVDEAAEDLARAVESGRTALRDIDDARAAIIACYVAMERSLAEAGAARAAAETPDELLARAVAAGLVPQGPATLLTGLFYEARYSTHSMQAAKRDQAERALADIAAELPAGEPA